MKLSELSIGSTATILRVGGAGALRQHFLDMGLIQGTEVTVVKYAPMGDPVELRIHSYELTIRLADAENIETSEPHKPKPRKRKWQSQRNIIRDMVREENSMIEITKILFRTVRHSHLPL